MERKTLMDRLTEVVGEHGKAGALTGGINDKLRSLAHLESAAAALNLLPLVLYRENSNTPEESGLEEYFYGKIKVQQYFSAVIEANLRERGWSQSSFAKKCKIAPSTASMILGGSRNPGIDTVEGMAGILNLTPQYLVPKRTGRPPLRVYKDSFEKVVETFQGYLIISGNEFPLADLHQAIEYGVRINELTMALKVRYDILKGRSSE